jgi:hypothetical protein
MGILMKLVRAREASAGIGETKAARRDRAGNVRKADQKSAARVGLKAMETNGENARPNPVRRRMNRGF